jgi:hypothetical protein
MDHGSDSTALSQDQRLEFYLEAVPKVRDFFAVAGIKLSAYLEPVSVNGKPTHRWLMDRVDSSRPQYIDPKHLAIAKELQASGACPSNLSQLLIIVKMARASSSAYYINELHERARVMATIGAKVAAPPDFFHMLSADVPAPERRRGSKASRPRQDEVAALSAGVRDMSLEVGPDQDDFSSVTDNTVNFVDVFSGGAQAPSGGSSAASLLEIAPSHGSTVSKQQKKNAKRAAKKAEARAHQSDTTNLLHESMSADAQGEAKADP